MITAYIVLLKPWTRGAFSNHVYFDKVCALTRYDQTLNPSEICRSVQTTGEHFLGSFDVSTMCMMRNWMQKRDMPFRITIA